MDDRYLYFSLTDPDFFDVPWAVADDEPLRVPDELFIGWRRRTQGPWQLLLPASGTLPDAGWKIHVAARPQDAQQTTEAVAAVCASEGVAWKVLRGIRLLRVAQAKYAPLSLSGKSCVVYPCDEAQLARVLDRLATALADVPAPKIRGDLNHPSAPLGLRWGGFREHWVQAPDGRAMPGLVAEHGSVADDRGTTPKRPLSAVAAALMGCSEQETPLPVRDVRLVHRCNAGSLYDARLADGRRVALKEARRHTALDADGVDAVGRLRHEHAVLTRLGGRDIAPAVLDYWCAGDSDVLVMEWIDGDSMITRISREHPRGLPGTTPTAARRFAAWADQVVVDLDELTDRLHATGVAHGDLHPGNVVLGPDGPRLVDFECATLDGVVSTTSLATPGYYLDHPDPVVRDRFALGRIRDTLIDPDVALVDRRPDLTAAFTISRPATGAPLPLPDAPAKPSAVPDCAAEMADLLADDLISRATPERQDRLFPGGVEQFTTPLGGHDLLSGAAGVLLALQAADRPPSGAHLDWLARVPRVAATSCHGLGEGVEGIALALALLGRPEAAAATVDLIAADLSDDLSWARGRAGCAVALVELGRLLGRDDLVERGADAARRLVVATTDPGISVPGPGLLQGWAGIALALLRLRELLDPAGMSYVDTATHALRREVDQLHRVGDCLVARPGGNTRTGLGHGSAALALAVVAHPQPPPDLIEAADAAVRACTAVTPPIANLIDGLAGSSLVLRLHGRAAEAAAADERATWHCAPTPRGWSTLGAQRLRCSDDLHSGSAGLVAALGPAGPARVAHVLRLPAAACEPAR